MIGSSQKTSEDIIVECLAKKSATAQEVHTYLLKKRDISLQAVYDQLRKLVSSGVLLKTGTTYVLSTEWTHQVQKTLDISSVPIIHEGEKMSYTFKSFQQADAFWKHIFHLYAQENDSLYIYNQHCFWAYLYGREESEELHYASYSKTKRTGYFLIGGETKLDFLFKKRYGNKFFKINCKQIKQIKGSEHITVIGDLIINSQVPQAVMKKIHVLYEKHNEDSTEFVTALNRFVGKIQEVSFRVERNRKKAAKLQKIITTDFVLSKKEKNKLLF